MFPGSIEKEAAKAGVRTSQAREIWFMPQKEEPWSDVSQRINRMYKIMASESKIVY